MNTIQTKIPKDQAWKYGGSSNPLFTGNFAHAENKNSDYTLQDLDAFDEEYCAHVKLKKYEKIYRCYTDRSQLCRIVFLVKINLSKNLVYFLAENDDDTKIVFSTKGIKLRWLNIIDKF